MKLHTYTRQSLHFIHDCNPHSCPCGYFQDAERACSCSPALVAKYQRRVSGPLLDRIDIHIEVPRVNYEKLSSDRLGEASAPNKSCWLDPSSTRLSG